MAASFATHQYCNAITGPVFMVVDLKYFAYHSVSYRRIFCTGKLKKDAYPGKEKLEPHAHLSFVWAFYSLPE